MRSHIKYIVCVAAMFMLMTCMYSAPLLAADDTLPTAVTSQAKVDLAKVGTGRLRKFGFRVYNATLWAPSGKWDATKPHVLQLSYTMDISKDTLIDTVMDDIASQGVADEAALKRWRTELEAVLGDVKDGDVLIGLALPGKNTLMFYNNKLIATITEQAFSDAFFGVWLGSTANQDLRANLLGSK